jgi:hypothetical protein
MAWIDTMTLCNDLGTSDSSSATRRSLICLANIDVALLRLPSNVL